MVYIERKERKLMCHELKMGPISLISTAMLRQFFGKQEFFG